jgi:transposase-like protein
VAWAFLENGNRELVGVSLGNRESYNAWKGFLEDLVRRGMGAPMLTIIDGCPGLIKAVDESSLNRTNSAAPSTRPRTSWIKCWNRIGHR